MGGDKSKEVKPEPKVEPKPVPKDDTPSVNASFGSD